MKNAFSNVSTEKQNRILDACFVEFSQRDYDQASLDRVVAAAGISKGGLYEYIESKEDLYLYVVQEVYSRLYTHLARVALPADILDRFRAVSSAAIDFYLDHPRCISIIVRTLRLGNPALQSKAESIFAVHFGRLFDSVDNAGLRFPLDRLIDLMKWLLAKTRTDYMAAFRAGADRETLRRTYMEEWDFVLSVMAGGIYARNGESNPQQEE